MPRALRLSAVLVAAVLSGSAAAQVSPRSTEDSFRQPDSLYDGAAHERRSQIVLLGLVVLGWGYGAAGRYSLPLLKDGFLPEVNDSFEVDLGGNIIFPAFGFATTTLALLAEPRWTFHFTPQLEAYAKLGLGVFIPVLGTFPTVVSPFQVLAAAGGSYRIGSNLSIRVEAGIGGFMAGAALDF